MEIFTQARLEGLAVGLATIWLDDLVWVTLRVLRWGARRARSRRHRKADPTDPDEWRMVQ